MPLAGEATTSGIDWQAVTETIKSLGLLGVALWSTYLTYRLQSRPLEEIFYERRLEAVENTFALMQQIRQSRERMRTQIKKTDEAERELNRTDEKVTRLEKSVEETSLGELNPEDLDQLQTRAEELKEKAKGIEPGDQNEFARTRELLEDLQLKTFHLSLYVPREATEALTKFIDAANNPLRDQSTDELLEAEKEFLAESAVAVGSRELDDMLKSRW